ncbi:hypothetical protein EDC30_104276 [Paucimonas lemoignei]|uniref:Uncharacterized protein n=1 Tax=Paucimonas lemoignei TaxID=29443 RepID=A0A4R3HWE6_PAULE|nr:hypothetical protein [Paucimonas lemoignei]TCS37472.1 hypothetical protein EDC30_104276 [Paucimonas lemoignei]
MKEEFVEITPGTDSVRVKVIQSGPAPVSNEQEDPIMQRMENWRRTVTGSLGGGASGFCASWAKWYVDFRTKREAEIDDMLDLPRSKDGQMPTVVAVDVLDGWIVEASVRQLDDAEKLVLRHWYVFKSPEHIIKRKLLLRRRGINQIRELALIKLKKVLDQVQNPANIPSNNFHAGNVPRPKTTVTPEGVLSSSGDKEASID